PGHRERLAAHAHGALSAHPGERIVIRGVARLGTLLAQPAVTLEYHGLLGGQDQVDGDVVLGGPEAHRQAAGGLALRRPITEPDPERLRPPSGPAGRPPARPAP